MPSIIKRLQFRTKAPPCAVCNLCKNLNPDLFEMRELRPPTICVYWEPLQESVETCLSCAFLMQLLEIYFAKFEIPPRHVLLVYEKTIYIQIGSTREIVLYSTGMTPWESIICQDHVKGPTHSEESVKLARDMIRECDHAHELCRMQDNATLPTRLLDLGVRVKRYDDTGSVRLWETGNVRASRDTRYACLSHCWGEKEQRPQPLKTMKENIRKHLEEIRLEALPRTFADAIDFTRRLGIRYIWIDSLCIIQDCKEDWEREAAQMSNIYQNCAICLAAPGSSNPGSGLYSEISQKVECISSSSPSLAKHPRRAKHSWTIFAREPFEHELLKDPSSISVGSRSYNPNSLRFRGWVYQERMLAPRVLQFLEKELAWDCRTESFCECRHQSHDMAKPSMGQKKLQFVSELLSASPSALAFLWRDMVSSYTSLSLTYQTDRLPAIAGIAAAIADVHKQKRAPGPRYHFGIWSDSAEQDLSWSAWHMKGEKETGNDIANRSSTRVKGTPTWSWASISTPIGFALGPDDQFESLCTIIDMGGPGFVPDMEPNSKQPQSQHLVVQGYLIPAKLDYQEEEWKGMNYTLQLANDEKQRSFEHDDFLELPGPSHIPSGETVYYFLLGKYRHVITCKETLSLFLNPSSYQPPVESCCLVLKRIDRSQDRYQRIGLSRPSMEIFAGRLSGQSRVCIC